MILYFSATGNCKHVAQRLAAARPTACAMSTAGVTADGSTCCQINESRSEALLHECQLVGRDGL